MSHAPRTSQSHPIRVDWLPTPWPGNVGLTFAPGKKQKDAITGEWDRDLETDLLRLKTEHRTGHLVCLLEDAELTQLAIELLPIGALNAGIAFHRLPIMDGSVPRDQSDVQFLVSEVVRWATRGENVVIHCKGGLGRAGTIGGCVLRAAGMDRNSALTALAHARGPSCPETREQRDFIAFFSGSDPGDRTDRTRGVLVGLAVGDALGAPVEFDPPQRIATRREELFGMPGGGAFHWAPGEFTDDTQMALVLARHLRAHQGSIDQDLLARDFAAWTESAADVGNQTRSVLSQVKRGVGWRTATGILHPNAAGNGSLMRVASVALCSKSAEAAMRLAREQSEVTHPNATCLDACGCFAWAIWTAINTGLPPIHEIAATAATATIRDAINQASDEEAPVMSGWVIHTLTGALWAVHGADSFEDAVWRAVGLGHDADTVGAIAGALAGAAWGLNAIPDSLSGALQSRHPLFVDSYPEALITLSDALDGRSL